MFLGLKASRYIVQTNTVITILHPNRGCCCQDRVCSSRTLLVRCWNSDGPWSVRTEQWICVCTKLNQLRKASIGIVLLLCMAWDGGCGLNVESNDVIDLDFTPNSHTKKARTESHLEIDVRVHHRPRTVQFNSSFSSRSGLFGDLVTRMPTFSRTYQLVHSYTA